MTISQTATLPIPLRVPAVRPEAAPAERTSGPSLARRRAGAALALALMVATLPLHLLGLALIGIEVLSPSTDGSGVLLVGGVAVAQLVLLVLVASIGQLAGGGGHPWRRLVAFSCVNAVLVLAAAGVAWAFLL